MLYRRMPVLGDDSPRGIAHEHHVEVLIGVLMQSFDLHAWIQRLPGDTGCLDVERADARLGEGHTALLSEEYSVSGGPCHTWHACSTRVVPRRKGDQTRFYGIGSCSRTPHGPGKTQHPRALQADCLQVVARFGWHRGLRIPPYVQAGTLSKVCTLLP